MRRFTFIFAGAVQFLRARCSSQACAASGGSEEGTDGDAAAGGDAAQTIDGSPVGTDSETPDSNEVTDTGAFDAGCVLTPPSNKCGIFPNCGCAGTTCDFVLDSGEAILPTACTPSVGAAAANASCAVSTDCQEGLTCLFDRCHEFCGNAGDPCSGCHSLHATTTHRRRATTSAASKCGPQQFAASCGSLGCVGVSDGTGATSECEPVGSGTNGVACSGPLGCAPGFYCVSNTTCRQTCNLASPVCATGSCNDFASPLIVDGVTYGYCN